MRVAAAGGSGVGGSEESEVDATVGAAGIVAGGAAGRVGVVTIGVRKWLSNGSVATGRGEGVEERGREVFPCATGVKVD